jgi:hypothetical protein
MKIINYFTFLCLLSLLSSCAQPMIYNGSKLPKTTSAEIFYSVSEVKKPYKVMGRIIAHKYSASIVKVDMLRFAKQIGADAIVIFGTDTVTTGKPNRIAAEALKYDK